MTRVLLISADQVDKKMAGPGIRYWEMAKALHRVFGHRKPWVHGVGCDPLSLEASGQFLGEEGQGQFGGGVRSDAEIPAREVQVMQIQTPPHIHNR